MPEESPDDEVDLPGAETRAPAAKRLARGPGGASGSAPRLPTLLAPLAAPPPAPAVARRRPTQTPRARSDNGFGGLTADGDYEIRVSGDRVPPAPWANVIANPHGGFVVTERGGGFTWAENSYFYRLTPWHNDPVSDPVSEVLYLRTRRPASCGARRRGRSAADAPYTVRHGAGVSIVRARARRHRHPAHARHGGGRAGQARRCCG